MACRSSVHESTGYTHQFLVFGQELSLHLDCMSPNPYENETTDIHKILPTKQQAFQRAFGLFRRNLIGKQKRRNVVYSELFRGATYKEAEKVLLHHRATPLRTTSKNASLWKRPYRIENCLSDVIIKIKDENTSKQHIVHYSRLKPFFEPPLTSNVPKRNKP